MKHLPNLMTLANLFFGCCAIVSVLSVHPYFAVEGQNMMITGMQDLYWGSIFIGLAACFDALDGTVARLLKVDSQIGKELDSLADVVSFGVAPSIIMYQLLWYSYMLEPGAMQTPLVVLLPAFLIACFAALRLAIFNISNDDQKTSFIGVPTPAVGLTIASLPLILLFQFNTLGRFLEYRWVLYALIALFCYLMVSKNRFIKLTTPSNGNFRYWPQMMVGAMLIISAFFVGYGAILIAFFTYVIVSLLTQPKVSNY